ncbi:MAG: type II secretion system F family protein [Anaerolineales bacterium]|nr:type II secretion system F family protein [Anaerolineales bacterium]MDW8160867.1 type II secretion system F family protein [Anaerolineales bacterium]
MDPLIIILFVGGAIVVALVIMGFVVTLTSEQALVEERLGRYIVDRVEERQTKREERATPIGDWVNERVTRSKWGAGIARELARADIKMKPGEYIALVVIMVVFVGGLAYFFGGRNLIFTLLGCLGGYWLPRLYIKRLQSQRLHQFNNQLADMLNLMVNGLRAGYSVVQAMEAVSKEMPSPISDEFRRVVQEMQLGIPMQVALDNLHRRVPSDDLDLIIAAINVQREVGGNLAEILDTISHTIRERVRIKGEIRVLTAQVVYSGRFLASMPLLILVILWLVNRAYMMQFFNPSTRIFGITMLVIGALMIVAGYYVMMRIANIEV